MKKYLVIHRDGDIFLMTPNEIENDNDSGAELRLLKVDKVGRIYATCET